MVIYPLFIQQLFIEVLLHARHCPRHTGYSSEKNKQNPFLHDPVVLTFLVGEDKQWACDVTG